MQKYDGAWVRLAFRGAQGAGPEVTRQVAEATGVVEVGRHVRALSAWARLHPGAEGNPDYWKDYKAFAIALMHASTPRPEPQRPR
jgi:hypothetical protein